MSFLWVFVETLVASGLCELGPDEARHVHARRLRIGDSLIAFDGQGRHAVARLESLGKRSAGIDLGPIQEETPPARGLTIASAIPKGDRLGTMLQMLTQLGLEVWQPLVLEESVVRKIDPDAARLRRILIESCKVARRPWRLEVRKPLSLDTLLANEPAGAQIAFGDLEGEASVLPPEIALVLVGPEAGFSEPERKTLDRAEARAVSFGPHNMRIETAAVAAATAFNVSRNASEDQRGGGGRADG